MSDSGHRVDVVVIGSGGAGLVAALRARDRGARVAVLEKTDRIGGTTAMSGGVMWIPRNHLMPDVDGEDSREDALAYLRRLAFGQSTDELLAAFVDSAPEMVRYLEKRTLLSFAAVRRPDYHPEWAGGKLAGRSLDIDPFDTNQLGAQRALLRASPHYPPITYRERYAWGRPEKFDWALIGERVTQGTVTMGPALVAGLLKSCLDTGVEVLTGMRARRLVRPAERVVGVQATDSGGRSVAFEADRAVVIASGGFEWNHEMEKHFLRGPELAPATVPSNTGDGILMGAGVGASLGNMNEAAWCPMVRIPGEEYEGQPVSRLIVEERSRPGSIIVNRRGRRFVNEATSYNSIVRGFHVFDPGTYDWANLPAYLVFDQRFRRRYNVTTLMPGDPTPPWMQTAPTPEALARALSVDPGGLAETIARFNAFAAQGSDPDFQRGESAQDRFNGDPEHGPNPCLGPLDAPPFFAVQLFPGTVGTKGGLRCDASARVLDVEEAVIRGLYVCGGAMASSMGIGYPSSGGMLGTGMTFAYIAGDGAGQDRA